MNYVSRWKIEEQFRFKKCGFNFEGFRVRSLNRINNLTMCLDAAITIRVKIIFTILDEITFTNFPDLILLSFTVFFFIYMNP